MLRERSGEKAECEGEEYSGRSANPLTGFRCSCHHQWPVGGVKAACCDMVNLGPQAVRELGPVEGEGSHDARATDGGMVIRNYQDRDR